MDKASRAELERESSRLTAETTRATRAAQVTGHPYYVAAVKAVRDSAVAAFMSADPADTNALQMARLRVDAMELMLTDLERHVQTGKLAENRLAYVKQLLGSGR
jgi:hypothetical protein